MTFHTSFTKGKRVILFMKDGTKIVGKWKLADRKRKIFIIDEEIKIPFNKVRSTGFYKEQSGR